MAFRIDHSSCSEIDAINGPQQLRNPNAMDTLVKTRAERFWNPEAYARDQWIKRQAELMPHGSRVLDAGAGASKYRPFFRHCRYETQDFCAYNGPLVKYLQTIDYICDITSIPLPEKTFDGILCTEVFEHLPDPMAALREFSRLTKPNGKLWLTAPFLSSLHMEPYHYYAGFTQYWYEYWLPRLGFTVDSIVWIGGPGRTAVVYLANFYSSWHDQEPQLPMLRRWLSKGLRLIAKVPTHVVLPRILPRLDRWLQSRRVASGLMVTATRR